jgi:isoamylase
MTSRSAAAPALDPWSMLEGSSFPLGAHRVPGQQAWNIALYARHATAVTVLLYSADDVVTPIVERPLDPLQQRSGRVWHCRISAHEAAGAAYYAFRVDGPHDPGAGHRFDPAKVLLDPYARGVYFPPGFSRMAASQPGSNAGRAPLGVLPVERVVPPRTASAPRHTHDLVIYEMHVRGFTNRSNSGVAADRRGTFAGVIDKIPYLVDLGVTAVELLPVHQFDPLEGNYWGYMTLGFFAPHQRYASGGL